MGRRAVVVVLGGSLVAGCAGWGARTWATGRAVPGTGVPSDVASTAPSPRPTGDATIADYMDRQKTDVEDVLGRDDRVEREGETVRITLASDALFDPGRSRVRPGARDGLEQIARVLNEHPRTRLDVIGHTDDRGRRHVNDVLSERRAAAVRDVLVREGVEPGRLTARGAGEARPVATNETAEGRAVNRRVEILSRPDERLIAEAREAERAASRPSPDVERR